MDQLPLLWILLLYFFPLVVLLLFGPMFAWLFPLSAFHQHILLYLVSCLIQKCPPSFSSLCVLLFCILVICMYVYFVFFLLIYVLKYAMCAFKRSRQVVGACVYVRECARCVRDSVSANHTFCFGYNGTAPALKRKESVRCTRPSIHP